MNKSHYLFQVTLRGRRAKSWAAIEQVNRHRDVLGGIDLFLFAFEAEDDAAAMAELRSRLGNQEGRDSRPITGGSYLKTCTVEYHLRQLPRLLKAQADWSEHQKRYNVLYTEPEWWARYAWIEMHPKMAKFLNVAMGYYFGRLQWPALVSRVGQETADYIARWR